MDKGRKFRVAILDLYEGVPNQGMRCLREILSAHSKKKNIVLEVDEFEVRIGKNIPDLSYDMYISSGGPGSPLSSEKSDWEYQYFEWLRQVECYNEDPLTNVKKQVLFICHSFQLVCRYYKVARVTKRRSMAFGVFPIHIQANGVHEPIFTGLKDPFFSVDSRDYQVVEPNRARLQKMNAHILAIEKERPHIPLERAIMAIRFNDYMVGTQFHPEADAIGMSMYLQREDRKKIVIDGHGEAKWKSMIEQLNDPDKILWTYRHILPNFINLAIASHGG